MARNRNGLAPVEGEGISEAAQTPQAQAQAAMDAAGPEGEGWASTVAGKTDVFFEAKEGASFQGVLIARNPSKRRRGQFYFHVKLTADCLSARRKVEGPADSKAEYEESIGKVGEVLSVDERSALEAWASLPMDGTTEVYARFIEKLEIADGTFWKIDARAREIRGKR